MFSSAEVLLSSINLSLEPLFLFIYEIVHAVGLKNNLWFSLLACCQLKTISEVSFQSTIVCSLPERSVLIIPSFLAEIIFLKVLDRKSVV